MTDRRHDCERIDDAGAYVLRALGDDEHEDYLAHLDACAACRAEVTRLKAAADTLPMAAPQLAPPPELKERLMRTVRAEAELLRAAGAEADRVRPARRRARDWWPVPAIRPLAAGAAAFALLAAGAGAGVLLAGGDGAAPTRTVAAQVAATGARASLRLTGDRGTLHVTGMPAPPDGRVYQVWLVRRGRATPAPTRTLFDVPADGTATVAIDQPLDGVREVLVSSEPRGGSLVPTSAPVIRAQPG